MSAFRIVLVDYDGTLAETKPAVAECLARTLIERGEPAPAPARLSTVIAGGLTLEATFASLAPHLGDSDIQCCVHRYRARYPEFDKARTTLFQGAREAIGALHELGIAIVILSNKGRDAIELALERFELAKHVTAVVAADQGAPAKPHPDTFHRRIVPLFGGAPDTDYLMVGDSASDIEFAQAVGIRTCWASYGYGDRDKCRALGPDYEVKSPLDLASIFVRP